MRSALLLLAAVGTLLAQRPAYFQQWVEYKIDVTLNPQNHHIYGTEVVNYKNNSPDTLKEIYFHLYLNAFKPGSSMQIRADVIRNRLYGRITALKPSEYGWTEIKYVKVNGKYQSFKVFDTILKIELPEPLLPGKMVKIEMKFESQIPRQTRRNGWGNREGIDYSMAQWYPKVCEYDYEGWHADQYIEREFYGVWGNFDVKITLPSNYLVGATGVIQNPDEVGCGYELGATDTIIFPSQWKPKEIKLKTWHFKAENVHDFAWVADRDYIHEITWTKIGDDTVIIHLLYQPDVFNLWRETGKFTKYILNLYSRWFWKYPYKSFTVAQAGDGGMEYPTLIMIIGRRSRLSMFGIIAHEAGHNWFYGLIGNNESKEAWLDEGFATFVTTRAFKEYFGEKWNPYSKKINKILLPESDIYGGYRSYIRYTQLGYEEPVLLHSDFFRESITYVNAVYGKGASVLDMLEYVVGDSVFWKIMKEYLRLWHFKHPNTKDFERVAEKVSGMELDWFFDEWLRTTRTCDYAIESMSGKWVERQGKRKYLCKIKLKNNGQIVMPIDLVLRFEDGSTQKVIIPLDLQLKPKNEPGAIVLPFWFWVNPEYEFELEFDKKVVSAQIDPSLRLRDMNRLNNSTGFFSKFKPVFLKQPQYNPPLDKYWLSFRPSIWFTEPDGFRFGLFENGAYLYENYATHVGFWYNTKTKDFDYVFNYRNNTSRIFGRLTMFELNYFKLHGVERFRFLIAKDLRPLYLTVPPFTKISFFFESISLRKNKLPFYTIDWERGSYSMVGFSVERTYYTRRYFSRIGFKFKTTTGKSFREFTNLSLKIEQVLNLRFSNLKLRIFGAYSYGKPPLQERFYLTASPMEKFSEKGFRMVSMLNEKISEKLNLFLKGGLNLRGYFDRKTSIRRGVGLSVDASFRLPVLSFVSTSLFFDAGVFDEMGDGSGKFKRLADFGFELGFMPLRFLPSVLGNLLSGFNRLSVNGVFPIWLSSPADARKFKLRWAIEIKIGV